MKLNNKCYNKGIRAFVVSLPPIKGDETLRFGPTSSGEYKFN